MSDIEEAILQSQENQIRREEAQSEYVEVDDLGITLKCPLKSMPDVQFGEYLAFRARILNKDPLLYYDGYTKSIRQGELEVEETKDSIMRLAAISYVRPGAEAYAWIALKRDLPKFDKGKLVVMPGLLFDRGTGALIKTDGKELTV